MTITMTTTTITIMTMTKAFIAKFKVKMKKNMQYYSDELGKGTRRSKLVNAGPLMRVDILQIKTNQS